jgi:hypothetical protein
MAMITNMSHEPIAVIRTYDELVAVVRRRIFALNTTFDAVDQAAGLADRHLSKILGPARPKHFGPLSLTLVLQTLGLALVVIEDGEQERIRARLTPRCHRVRPEPDQAGAEAPWSGEDPRAPETRPADAGLTSGQA